MSDWDVVGEEPLGTPEKQKPKPNDPWAVVEQTPLNAKPAAIAAKGRNPDAVAEADRLARRAGVPLAVAERNPDDLKQQSLLDQAAMLPARLATWLMRDPDNAAVSQDDWGVLSTIESAMRTNPITASSLFFLNPKTAPNPVRAGMSSFIGSAGSSIEGLTEVPAWQLRQMQRGSVGMAGLFSDEWAQQLQANFDKINQDYGWLIPQNLIRDAGQAVGGEINKVAARIDVPEAERDWIDELGAGIGSLAAFATVGRFAGPAGVATMGAGLGADQQADEARQAGLYETGQGDSAMALGGVVSGVSESIGFKWLTRAIPEPAKKYLANRIADIIQSGLGEGAQEFIENTSQNLITQQLIDPNRDLFAGVGTASSVGFTIGSFLRGAQHVAHKVQDSQSAVAENETLKEILRVSQGSKLFQRSPERYKDAMAALKSQGMEDVYVPAAEWRQLFQSQQENEDARQRLGVSDEEYAAALLSNGRVRIPTESFLSDLTPEQQNALSKNARFQPDGIIPEEARSFDATEAMKEYMAQAGFRPSGIDNEVYNEYVARLTGPYTRKEAEALAETVAGFARAYGGRTEMVDDIIGVLIERTGLKADTKLPKAVQEILSTRKDVVPAIDSILDMLRTRQFPTDREMYGPTLLEAVRSWGGINPNAFGAGDLAAMDAQRQQLFRADGITLEDALIKAVNDGYIDKLLPSQTERYDTNAADINDLINALSNDLGGVNPTYSPQFANLDRQGLAAAAEDVARVLDEKGIDLNQVDNATARRMMGWFTESTDVVQAQAFEQVEQPTDATTSGRSDQSDAAEKRKRLKEIRKELEPFINSGGLSAEEGKVFRALAAEYRSLAYDLAKPLTEEKIKSPSERLSTLPASIVITAQQDLLRNREVYDRITEAAEGVAFNADTAVDRVMDGNDALVSPQEMYDAFAATRESLRSEFGDTMTLYRATGKQKPKATTNWATTDAFARQFGNNVISKEISVDDIIAVNVGIGGGYHEVIVGSVRDNPNILFQSVSTRLPTAKRAIENPLEEMLIIGLEASKADPKAFEKNVELLRQYPNFRDNKSANTADKAAEQFIKHVADNLMWLHDQVPAETRERSKLWYDGARAIVDEWTGKYGVTDAQIAGIMAVLSPQKDWFQNVSMAERVLDAMTTKQDFVWSDEMSQTATGIEALNKDLVAKLTGKTLAEAAEIEGTSPNMMQAMWIRIYDQAYNERGYRVVSPEGEFTDWVYNADGVTKSKVGWGSFTEIGKAVSIFKDGAIENISRSLGEQHKVRNFYNNIFSPNSEHGDVTIDTHAVAAGLLRPLSGSSAEVLHNFGDAGSASSSIVGSRGTYGIYAEAYRRAAAARGILPREMQSITWEAVRGLYTAGFKSQKSNVAKIDTIWDNYKQRRISLDEARKQLVEAAGGINAPEWDGSGAGSPGDSWTSSYAGELLGVRRAAGAAGRGEGGVSADPAAQVLYQGWYRSELAGNLKDLGKLAAKDGSASTDQVKAWVTKRIQEGRFKKAEVEAIGLMEYLGTQGLRVSVADVQAFVEQNGVRVTETQSPVGKSIGTQDFSGGSLVLPGGENYRELLLTLPHGRPVVIKQAEQERAAVFAEVSQLGLNIGTLAQDRPDLDARLNAANRLLNSEDPNAFGGDVGFKSSHWDQPNVLAHVRFNERTVPADGPYKVTVREAGNKGRGGVSTKTFATLEAAENFIEVKKAGGYNTELKNLGVKRVLFIEEIQSDWAQQGRKQGFGPQLREVPNRRTMRVAQVMADQQYTDRDGRVFSYAVIDIQSGQMVDGTYQTAQEAIERMEEMQPATRTELVDGIPTAPFVTDTNAWVQLALKRMVAYAVENGFDKVAFVNGQQSADRYDLSKQVDSLLYKKNEDGSYQVSAQVGGRGQMLGETLSESDLENNVGKEVAKKIVDGEGKDTNIGGNGSASQPADLWKSLSGVDLKVGGEGMKSFYDKIVPQNVRAVLKKLGGGEMGEVQFGSATVFKVQIGEDTYETFSTEEAAEDYISENDALEGVDIEVDQNGGMTQPAFDITPAMREAVDAGLPLFQRKRSTTPRGALLISDKREFIIQLGKARDWSTFLHESAHLYLEIMREVDAKLRASDSLSDSQRQVLADHETILRTLGVTAFDQIGRDQHEAFAETYEAYLREGQAPSQRLQSAFQKFGTWLKLIYRTLAGLPNQRLNPEITEVFNRMLATDAEIDQAMGEQGIVPKFKDAASAGMTDAEYQQYLEAIEIARRQATDDEMRRQYDYMRQEQKAWWQQEFQAMREEVAAEVNADPVYIAMAQMRHGAMPDGSALPADRGPVKLNTQVLLDMYGRAFVQKHFMGMHNNEGVHPSVAAQGMGFASADDMVTRIANAQPRAAFINAEARRRMEERHPDPMSDPDLPERAAAAVNSEAAENVVIREIVALGGNREIAQAMKAVAKKVVSRTPIRNLKPNQYRIAQQQAGRAAIKSITAGSKEEGLKALREQLMAGYMLREATAAIEAADKTRALGQRLAAKAAQERLAKAGGDYLTNVNLLLGAYEFRRVSNKELERRAQLRRWVEEAQAAGDVTAVSDELLAQVEQFTARNWRDATPQQLSDLNDALSNLNHLAGLQNKLISARDKADYETAVAAMVERIRATNPKLLADVVDDFDLTTGQKVRQKIGKMADELTRPETLIEALDGGESGPFHDYIWWPQEQSEAKINELQGRVGKLLIELNDGMPKDFLNSLDQDVTVRTERGQVTMKRYTLVSAVLNKGNETSRQRLRDGGITTASGQRFELTDAEVDALPGLLTGAELRYAQGLWDIAGSMREDIEAMTQELAGVPVQFVESKPFEIRSADGQAIQMRGGYWPLVYHSDRSTVGDRQAGDDALKVMMGMGFSRAATSKGYTKTRVEELKAPLRLNLGYVLAKNLNDVMTDVAYRKTVRDVQRLLKDPRIKSEIVARLGDGAYRAVNGGLAYSVSANGDAVDATARTWGAAADWLMSNASVSILAIRPDIALGNYGSSLVQGLTRVEKKALIRGLRALYLDRGETTEKIKALSPLMANRLDDIDNQYRQALLKTQGKSGFRNAYARVMMTLHRAADHDATRALWWGRYTQERAKGADQEEAVRLADKTIRQTQTTSGRKDLSIFERDTQFKQSRLFMGPMMVIFGQIRQAVTGKGIAAEGQGARLALGLNALFFAPAVFALLAGRWPEDGGDDDEEGLEAGDWGRWLVTNTGLMFAMQTMPIFREAAGVIEAAFSDKPINPRAAPSAQAAAQMVKATKSLWKQAEGAIEGDDIEYDKLTADLVSLTAPLTGLPASQWKRAQRSLDWIEDNPDATAAEMAKVMLYGPPR